mgnify:CR=1 FL=1
MTSNEGFQTGTAQLEGAELYYEIAGEGPPLVLVHAGFVDRRMWDDQFPVFACHHKVIRYDQRGFGNSKATPGPFSHRRDLYQLLQFLGVDRAHLLGCSMGGATIIDFALEYPEMTASLIPVSSALGGYPLTGDMPEPLQELFAALQGNDLSRAADLAVQIWVDGPQRTPDKVDAGIRERVRAMSLAALPNFFVEEEPLDPPAFERLNEIATPTLIIAGELDDPLIGTMSEYIKAHIAEAQAETIIGAAHLLNMEKPDKFNRAVLDFLQQIAG